MGTRHIEIEQIKTKMQAEFDQLVSQMRQDFDKMMLEMGGKKPKDKHHSQLMPARMRKMTLYKQGLFWDKVYKAVNSLHHSGFFISEKGVMPIQVRVINSGKDDFVFEVGEYNEGYYHGSHVLPDIKVPFNGVKLKHILDIMLECYQKHVSVL